MSDMAPSARGFSGDRLKAFRTHFRPSNETLAQRISNLAVTAAIYGVILAAAVGLGTANVPTLLRALHVGV